MIGVFEVEFRANRVHIDCKILFLSQLTLNANLVCVVFPLHRYTDALRGNLSDIFQRIIDDSTFSQRSQFIQSMQLFAYSLLDGQPCDSELVSSQMFAFIHTHTGMPIHYCLKSILLTTHT